MYVSYNANRNEFLEKFKQDHRIEGRSQNSKSKNKLNADKISNFNDRKSSNTSYKNDSGLNNSSNLLKISGMDGRWDYLYRLEKLNKSKLEHKRKIKENELFKKDLTECTFSPKLNKIQNQKHLFNSNFNIPSPTFQEKNNPTNALPTDQIINSKIYSGNMIERQEWWEYKKKLKIENIRHNQYSKNIKECVFQPKIVSNYFNVFKKNSQDILKKMEIERDAENLLVDPESYNSFINRQQKFREEKESLHKRQKSTPGCGRLWTNKITKPSEFNIKNEVNNCSESIYVKSLEKPITHGKFLNIKNNYRAGDNKENKTNKKNISDIVYAVNDHMHYDELFEDRNKQNSKFDEKIDFAVAMKQLHEELYSIDLLNDEE